MKDLQGQTVVIVGGTSGIGLATASAAADAGARVFAAGRSKANLEQARASAPASLLLRQVDIHDRQGLAALFEEAGPIDHLVACATGASRTVAPFMQQSAEQFSAAFDKFWGYANLARLGVPHLTPKGSLTFVSGWPARKCNPGMSSISCVGGAVENLGRALALELAPRRVNIVAPGLIDTGMFPGVGDARTERLAQMAKTIPLGRVGLSEEVAAAVLLVMLNDYMTGATLDVDGGVLLP